MTIGRICNHEVITVQRDATIHHAAMLMRQYHVGDVVVIENREDKAIPIGIITDRDVVVDVVATELDCKVFTVGDIMVPNLITVKDNAGILEAIELMTKKGIRRLPVVDEDGSLLGIVTLDDLLTLLTKEIGSLSKLVTCEQKNEASKRH
jgi:CBS domain-containing protein